MEQHDGARNVTPLVPPPNYGLVDVGLHRSGYPPAESFRFIDTLRLRSVLYLSSDPYEDEDDGKPEGYARSRGLAFFHCPIRGHKEVNDPWEGSWTLVMAALGVVLDTTNHPVHIHCNRGKHRTGVIVGAYRLVCNWSVASVLDEYHRYAGCKARDEDLNFLRSFDADRARASLQALSRQRPVILLPQGSETCGSGCSKGPVFALPPSVASLPVQHTAPGSARPVPGVAWSPLSPALSFATSAQVVDPSVSRDSVLQESARRDAGSGGSDGGGIGGVGGGGSIGGGSGSGGSGFANSGGNPGSGGGGGHGGGVGGAGWTIPGTRQSSPLSEVSASLSALSSATFTNPEERPGMVEPAAKRPCRDRGREASVSDAEAPPPPTWSRSASIDASLPGGDEDGKERPPLDGNWVWTEDPVVFASSWSPKEDV